MRETYAAQNNNSDPEIAPAQSLTVPCWVGTRLPAHANASCLLATVILFFIISEMRPNNSEEVLRLRRQLERSKESRKTMAEQHDEAVARLEQAKEVGFESISVAFFSVFL